MKHIIGQIARGALATLIAVGLLIGSAAYQIRAAAAATVGAAEWDGLVRVSNKRLDHVYVLPEASFSGYKRIRLSLVEVSFDRNWPNSPGRSGTRVSAADMEQIRRTLATEFRQVFADELGKSGYTLVDENGEDVLAVFAAIGDLYISGAATPTTGPSRTYVANTGRMTLVAELRDSVTGQLLGRAVDTVQGRSTGRFQLATPSGNLAEARDAMRKWAAVLRTGLDDAEGRSGTP